MATTLHNLAVLYVARGSLPEAAALSQRALAVFEKTLGKNHPHTAVCRKNDVHIARLSASDTANG